MAIAQNDMKEALIALIENEWRDIHHSRLQEWSALGVVTGVHIALTQIPKLLVDTHFKVNPHVFAVTGLIASALFAVVGMLLTFRHRRLMQIKLNWIYEAEANLGLIKTDQSPFGVIPLQAQMSPTRQWRGLALPRLLSTSGLIALFYAILILVDSFLAAALLL